MSSGLRGLRSAVANRFFNLLHKSERVKPTPCRYSESICILKNHSASHHHPTSSSSTSGHSSNEVVNREKDRAKEDIVLRLLRLLSRARLFLVGEGIQERCGKFGES